MEFLRVSGGQITDAKGKKVRLRGTCPGGWMNMEDFINGHPGAEHTLRAQMAGSHWSRQRSSSSSTGLLNYFFNEDDVIFLRKSGANVARIPLNYRHFEDDAAPYKMYKESGFARASTQAYIAATARITAFYVILDLTRRRAGRMSTRHS